MGSRPRWTGQISIFGDHFFRRAIYLQNRFYQCTGRAAFWSKIDLPVDSVGSRGEKTVSKIKSAYLFTALEGSKSRSKHKSAYLFLNLKSEKNTNFRTARKMNKKN